MKKFFRLRPKMYSYLKKRQQDSFKTHLNHIKNGTKSEKQKKVLGIIDKFYDAQKYIDFSDNFNTIMIRLNQHINTKKILNQLPIKKQTLWPLFIDGVQLSEG